MKIVAMKEKSEGNDTVGTAWVETAIFDESATLADVLKWSAKSTNMERVRLYGTRYGRLMLSIADEPAP